MEGFIALHRKILEWDWYEDSSTFKLFIHCLIKANHKDKNWKGKIIKRGQFITSIEKLSNESGLTQKQVRTAIKKLIKTNELGKQSTNRNTMITVLSYDNYQTRGRQRADKGQTRGRQGATTNNDNNDNNENNEIKKDRVAPDFKSFLDHAMQKAIEKNINLDKSKVKTKYDSWLENGWKDLNENPIKNWKVKITSNIIYWEKKGIVKADDGSKRNNYLKDVL